MISIFQLSSIDELRELSLTSIRILVPIYGALGAAILIFSSVAIQNFIMVFYLKQQRGFNTLNLIKQ